MWYCPTSPAILIGEQSSREWRQWIDHYIQLLMADAHFLCNAFPCIRFTVAGVFLVSNLEVHPYQLSFLCCLTAPFYKIILVDIMSPEKRWNVKACIWMQYNLCPICHSWTLQTYNFLKVFFVITEMLILKSVWS